MIARSFVPKKNTPDRDLVMTPPEVAKDIIDHFKPTGTILDPCRGTGAFYNQFPKKTARYWCELSEGVDFFQWNTPVDWIITNPPWSKVRQFLVHSTLVSDNICFLIPFNHFATKCRLRIIQEAGFGIKEFYGVATPKNKEWPGSGFQLGVTHIQRGYSGPINIAGTYGA